MMDLHRPHGVHPRPESARVVIAYKNFAAHRGVSHIGLGVSALNTAQTLRAAGIWCDVWPVSTPEQLEHRLREAQDHAHRTHSHRVSHVVVSAPWIPTPKMQAMLMAFPDVHFAVNSHSNIGFLMADPSGIKLLREAGELALGYHNFSVAGNSSKFVSAWEHMYGVHTAWLPNLYNVETARHVGHRTPWHKGVLRLGVFGATRPLKNMVTAVGAAVELSSRLKADVEIWMSSGREEGAGRIPSAIEELTTGLPHVKVVKSGWQSWPKFRQVVRHMHLLLQPSYTESFNMVTADGVIEGVASVVSDAIDWAPADWVANADNVDDVARVAQRLLHDTHAVDEGQHALRRYVHAGLAAWREYLRVA
jgi:hypothetical protein